MLRLGVGVTDSLGMNLATLRRHDGRTTDSTQLAYTQALPRGASLVWSASRLVSTGPQDAPGSTSPLHFRNVQLMAFIPLGREPSGRPTLMTGQLQRQRTPEGISRTEGVVTASSPLALEDGWGWRAQAGRRAGQSLAEGGVQRQWSSGLVGLDASALEGGVNSVRATAQGALMWTEGRMLATRRIQDAWALVQVPGLSDVGVGLDGESITRTDSQGWALLPRLMARGENRVRLSANDLPPEAEIDTIEQMAVPAHRAGVKVSFAVRQGRAALLDLQTAEGQPIPVGSVLRLEGEERTFPVGRQGRVYVTGLREGVVQRAELRTGADSTCTIRIELPVRSVEEIKGGLQQLGPLRCEEPR